jgi:hypothetical protein
VIESSIPSICRDLSQAADDLDAYGEAFGITLVSRRVTAGAYGALTSGLATDAPDRSLGA